VNLGSLAGKEGLRWLPVYSAASGGVIAFTKALAKELTETSVRVNCIAPGPIETDMILDLGPETVDAMIEQPGRQWVLNVSSPLRFLLASCPDIVGAVLAIRLLVRSEIAPGR
jgi:NAD(P)-dependent dehydrogenase (short-subunit alcohol dehydrogenase family)